MRLNWKAWLTGGLLGLGTLVGTACYTTPEPVYVVETAPPHPAVAITSASTAAVLTCRSPRRC